MKLHIGGEQPKEGWTILNIAPAPYVDIVANCVSLDMLATGSVETVYASHVLEHLNYKEELPRALSEVARVLRPGGELMCSVPDLTTLCWLYSMPHLQTRQRLAIMDAMFGGGDHRVGLAMDFLEPLLVQRGFREIQRVEPFGLFKDFSDFRILGMLISLNLRAVKA